MRVAFAAAAYVESDILVIDEALAVGDAVFQRKCFQHLEKLKARGVTILLVTHQASLVTQICSRALILQKGELVFDGKPREAAKRYVGMSTGTPLGEAAAPIEKAENEAETRFGSGRAKITAIEVSPPQRGDACYATGEIITISISARFNERVDDPDFGFSIKSLEGVLGQDLLNSLHDYRLADSTAASRRRC